MSEQQIVDYLKAAFGPGVIFGAWLVGRAIAKLVRTLSPIIIDAITEMKMLRAGLDEVKKYGPRIDKLEVDVDEGFKRIRKIEANGATQ